jgi:predicted glycosyltransferase
MFRDQPPEVAISHQSEELSKFAFGPCVLVLTTVDTPLDRSIVVRQTETKAAYGQEKEDYAMEAAHKLSSFGTIIFLLRYCEPTNKNVIV